MEVNGPPGRYSHGAEGLDVFKVDVPQALAGKTIAESAIRRDTGCNVIAVDREGGTVINPRPDTKLEAGTEIVIIGTVEGEKKFLGIYDER